MSRLVGHGLAGLVAFALSVSAPRIASACGGCFAPPTADQSFVTGHRMAFSVNATRTVLWDQFEYQGSPEDFTWVLPVRDGAWVEESVDAWLESLDSFTTTRVFSPPLVCAQPEASAFNCGSSDSAASASGSGGTGGGSDVVVKHRGTVGPYNTVTLSSQDPKALETWLEQHGYVIPDYTRPIIAAYVAEGFDFIALRLQPGQGVQQMTPVRVVTPGGDSQLPLRMVAAGATSFVDITLFVIGEHRFAMPDMSELSVPHDELVWDWSAGSSNYLQLRKKVLAENSGRTYLTTFAMDRGFSSSIETPAGFTAQFVATTTDGSWYSSYATAGELYFGQAAANEGASAGNECSGAVAGLGSSSLVVDNCDPDTGQCAPLGQNELSASSFDCGDLSDLSTAMVGMHPSKVWLTRLEMRLPQTALDADCVVEPALKQDGVENMHQAKKSENAPCQEPVFNGSPAIVFGSLFGMWFTRRRSRRRA
jgi:hypothetical protein